MLFSNLLLSVATVGTTTLAFALAAPASAQENMRIDTTRTRITRTPAIATTPIMTRVARSSFIRRKRW